MAAASPNFLTFQARIVKPDGMPLEATSVYFKFRYTDNLGTCVLYEEEFFSVSMANSRGLVVLVMGGGIKVYPAVTFTLYDVFNFGVALNCQDASPTPTVTPTSLDRRKVILQFDDGNGLQTLAGMDLNSVPFALHATRAANAVNADNADQLGGAPANQFTKFTDLGTAASLNAGLAQGNIVVLESGGKLPLSTLPSTLISSSSGAGGDLSGTYPSPSVALVAGKSAAQVASAVDDTIAATNANTVSTIVKRDASGNFSTNTVSSINNSTNNVYFFDATNATNAIRMSAPTGLAASFNLTLPGSAGASGQVLSTNGLGTLAWIEITGTNSGVNTGDQTITLTSDVTGSGTGSFATTIANDAVSNAKAANMVVNTIKGRSSSGTGDPEDLTATQVRTILNVADGANNYVHPNHTGDVTSAADGAQTIAANAVTTVKIADGAVTTTKAITTNPGINRLIATDGTTGANLAALSCAAGEVLKWNVTNGWVCAVDNNSVASVFARTGAVVAVSGDYTVGQVTGAEASANKDATGGYAGLTLFRINFKNAANTFTNFFTNATSAARTYTFPDKDITVAGLVDITGTNSGTNTGDQTITLTSDVTGSGTGSFATTIANDAVSNVKAANMAVSTIKGRSTAGTGDPEDLTATQVRTILNVADGANALTTNPLSQFAATTSVQLIDVISNEIGTGALVFADTPTFTGTPAAPTATAGTNTTQLATTAFVTAINNNASYRTIADRSGSHIAARVAGTYAIPQGDPIPISGDGTVYPWGTIYIDPADYPTINGITTILRIRAQVYVNDVAPTGNFTFGLYPVTRPATAGGAGVNIYTIGTVITGSNGATVVAPAADSAGNLLGADFAIPAAGHYVIGVLTSATVAADSLLHISAQLQMRNP